MIEKNKETNKYHAICDCCHEYSDEYGSFKQCQYGIEYEGWKRHYKKKEGECEHFCPNCME